MKKIFLICTVLTLLIFEVRAQAYDKNCFYGITFDVGKNPSWGYGELVITDVEPDSPAEQAGIKIGDIIMEINGKATYLRDNATIADWLFSNNYDPVVTFTIRNMNTYFKEYTLTRRCINANATSEQELSRVFDYYSMEDTNRQIFTLPISVDPNTDADFTDYHTYGFDNTLGDKPIDKHIISLLDHNLQAKGLTKDYVDPDIVVGIYYDYNANPKFTGLNELTVDETSLRFDVGNKKLVRLPLFDVFSPNSELQSQYKLKFGIQFSDRKYIDTLNMVSLWKCEINDNLSKPMAFEEYLRINIPLMLMQFPYSDKKAFSDYEVSVNRYYYTGLYFNMDDYTTIQDVDQDSPAFAAGLRTGYVIRSIDDYKFSHTKESLFAGYELFKEKTMKYRDLNAQFRSRTGDFNNKYWNKIYYADIAKEFSNKDYKPAFAYLYGFEPYVNAKPVSQMKVEAWFGNQLRIYRVEPQLRSSVTIKAL